MRLELKEGQIVKMGVGKGLVRAYSREKDVVVLERLDFQLFGKTEYIVGKHPANCPAKYDKENDLMYIEWYLGKYFYKLEDAVHHAGAYPSSLPKDNIKLQGLRGTWYVISEDFIKGQKYYLLESEQLGEEQTIIVGRYYDLIMTGVHNGFKDLRDRYGWD